MFIHTTGAPAEHALHTPDRPASKPHSEAHNETGTVACALMWRCEMSPTSWASSHWVTYTNHKTVPPTALPAARKPHPSQRAALDDP